MDVRPSETANRRNDRTKRSRVAGFQARLVFATAMKERASEEIRRKNTSGRGTKR